MIVRRNLKLSSILFYTWRQLLYYLLLSSSIYILHYEFQVMSLDIPSYTITALGTALAIFLGFKNNNAYDRWWEARKIWGLMVNYSRAWTRQVKTLIIPGHSGEAAEVSEFQQQMAYRHLAFVKALRVFLRQKHDYNHTGQKELVKDNNTFLDVKPFLSRKEYQEFTSKDNPPNFLIHQQGEALMTAYQKGWLSDYRFVKMEETLVDFNDIQGKCERIKNTPLPRQYSFFSRVFVMIHCTLLPMVFISELGWKTIPIAVTVSFVFLALDLIGDRTEDPFENRLEDTPLTSLGITIETNVREQLKEDTDKFPQKYVVENGVVL